MMRLIAKTFSWSLTHMTVAIAVAYMLTRDWRAALAVGLIEPMFQTVAFVIHERLWTRGARVDLPTFRRALFHSHASPATSGS